MDRSAAFRYASAVASYTLDTNTPAFGTAVSEWRRRAARRASGATIHRLNNLLSCLVAVRYEAEAGWTDPLVLKDRMYEAQLAILTSNARELVGCGPWLGRE